MQDWLAARASATPQRIALIYGEQQWTYQALEHWVQRACAKYATVGVRAGRVIAVLMHNSPEYVVTVHAVARLGAVLLPLNTRLTADELNFQVNHARVALLFYTDPLAELASELTPNRMCVTLDSLPEARHTGTPNVDLTNVQAIVFTSGTTGTPKGAQITFGNHFYSALGSAYRIGHHPDDRWLSVLPLYHVGGLAVLFRSVLYGIGVILHTHFDMPVIEAHMQRHRAKLISLVPTMLYRMMSADVYFPPSLRLILLGGAAASTNLLTAAYARGLPVAPTYGLTEAASQVATMLPNESQQKMGSVGKPLMFTQVQIVGMDNKPLPTGHIGEIVVQGLSVMRGYLRADGAAGDGLHGDRLYTGDMGYLDADGDLWLVQRRSDLIVSGGENVYPSEVEAHLESHPSVQQACVVGVPHPEWGQQVVAVLVLHPQQPADADALTAYCRQKLAGYKVPRQFYFWDSLPLNASGKLLRREVIARLTQG